MLTSTIVIQVARPAGAQAVFAATAIVALPLLIDNGRGDIGRSSLFLLMFGLVLVHL